MVEVIFELIRRLTIFMVISKMILYMDIGKGYEKYTKLFISFMVIVQLISGISSLWSKDNFQLMADGSSYYDLWKGEMSNFEERLIYFQNQMEEKKDSFLKQETERMEKAAENNSDIKYEQKIYIEQIKIE